VVPMQIFSTFWLSMAAGALSLAWLLPNHYPPWMSFHCDAWAAAVLTAVGGAVLVRSRGAVQWNVVAVLVAMMAVVPMIQFASGQVLFFGISWINSAYLVGLLLALLIGAQWESETKGQAADLVFGAIGVASIISVGLTLHQWLRLDSLEFWVLPALDRPYGNLGQPNQLASLLVLGILSCGWGVAQGKIHQSIGYLMAGFILLGLMLTQSRTGWLNLFILMGSTYWWGWKHSSKALQRAAIALSAYAVSLSFLVIPWLRDQLHLKGWVVFSDRLENAGIRTDVWMLFIDAIVSRPLFGYGWGYTEAAHLALAPKHVFLGSVFAQSHNLILDLMVWNGIALGLIVALVLIYAIAQVVRRVSDCTDGILLLFLVVLGVHSMLEYPLHYAYFLLPAGLVWGVLNARLKLPQIFVSARSTGWVVWMIAAGMLGVTVRDYVRVEPSFYDLRFEKARVQMKHVGLPPEVWVLDQMREMIVFARTDARPRMSAQELAWMRNITNVYPSAYNVHKLATALAMNYEIAEAQHWLRVLCTAFSTERCEAIKATWRYQSTTDPSIANVPWPDVSN
jgi:O-antigen ligase